VTEKFLPYGSIGRKVRFLVQQIYCFAPLLDEPEGCNTASSVGPSLSTPDNLMPADHAVARDSLPDRPMTRWSWTTKGEIP
jgi:hypothetical protein